VQTLHNGEKVSLAGSVEVWVQIGRLNRIKGNMERNMKAKKPPPPPLPQKNKKANLKKLVNNTMKGRAAKNVSRLKKNINEGISEMTVKTRLAQLNKQTKYQQK
jgi:hypothetical protein